MSCEREGSLQTILQYATCRTASPAASRPHPSTCVIFVVGQNVSTTPRTQQSRPSSRTLEGVECLIGVPNERQAHLRILLTRERLCLSTMESGIVFLWDLVDGEVAEIHVRCEPWLKGSTDVTQLFPDHATEEWMSLDRGCPVVRAAVLADSVIGIAEEAMVALVIRTCQTLVATKALTFESCFRRYDRE